MRMSPSRSKRSTMSTPRPSTWINWDFATLMPASAARSRAVFSHAITFHRSADGLGNFAIAKFPSPSADRWNVMAWEKTALDLAALAGINVAKSQLIQVDGRGVLIVDRFDRDGDIRIGYVSAMTMVEARDGDHRSYLDIAGVIEQRSPVATSDLRQLWRRIALSVLISNTDDHLRNHGFVHRSADSWVLSPAFDINPNPDPGPKHLATAIEADDTTANIDNLMGVAPLFRLDHDSALHVLLD